MLLEYEFKDSTKIIDTHCHLDDESYFNDLSEVLAHSFDNNIDKIIIPAACPKDLPRAVELSENYEQIYFAVGTHPNECQSFDEPLLREFITHEKCVGVGECGLDYHYISASDTDEKAKQKQIFAAQLELASEFQKPVIIHCREATQDTYELIKAYQSELVGGVFHCFNASEMLLDLKDKFYYGIGGVLTFKNAKNLISILSKIPKERLLLETDAPYLSPEPLRGKRNEPLLTHFVATKMAQLLNLQRDELIQICTQNSQRLFFKRKNDEKIYA